MKAGDRVGLVGVGGLGNMAIKLARAVGAEVWDATTSKDKLDELAALGATGVLKSDRTVLKAMELFLGFMLSTIPEKHDLNPFVPLLKRDGSLVVVGALEAMAGVNDMEVAMHRRMVAGSLIGSIAETQEVLDFCAAHAIAPEIEVIPIQDVNRAYEAVEKGDVRFRYLIDMASLKAEMADS